MGVLAGDSIVVESNREPATEFVADAPVWASRVPDVAAIRRAADVLRPLVAKIRNTRAETQPMTPEEIRTLRSLGYVGGS